MDEWMDACALLFALRRDRSGSQEKPRGFGYPRGEREKKGEKKKEKQN